MRFDSEVLVTVAVLAGLWHYFARVSMNAKNLSLILYFNYGGIGNEI
jgi:hypothetical protein